MKKKKGFTLIEMLIAIAIVAIIASIALPSYNETMRKARRSDASAALTKAAMMQERAYTTNNKFSGVIANLGGNTSEEGQYTISVDITACTSSCFILSATPVTGEAQDNDDTCWTISISHTGNKYSANKVGVTNPRGTCW